MIKIFSEIVDIRKTGACETCRTYSYTLPINLTTAIGNFLLPIGKVIYNLDKCKIIRIENEAITLSGARVGTNSLKVKFKRNPKVYQELFNIHLAAFLESEMNISIKL